MPAIKEKIKIGGIKLSSELVQLNLMYQGTSSFPASYFFQILTKNQINMPFVSTSFLGGRLQSSCCILPENLGRVKELVQSEDKLKGEIEFIHSVGMVSLFPHQYRLKVLGIVLYALGSTRLPLYGMSSSISALTFITAYSKLDAAVVSLAEYMNLPLNHSPFTPGTP